jgi:hypothetical protein
MRRHGLHAEAPCPRCKAPPGHACSDVSDVSEGWVHTDRSCFADLATRYDVDHAIAAWSARLDSARAEPYASGMSMFSQAGASSAASEILHKVRQEQARAKTPEAREALERLARVCLDILSAADAGWY